MNTKRIGDITESLLISKFIEGGCDVYPAFGENTRADMIIDDGCELYRVQVKTARYRDGKVVFNTEGWWSNTNTNNRTQYDEDCIDIFAAYCSDLEEFYVVDVNEATKSKMHLRVDEPKNNQTKNIRWEEEYRLEKFIE